MEEIVSRGWENIVGGAASVVTIIATIYLLRFNAIRAYKGIKNIIKKDRSIGRRNKIGKNSVKVRIKEKLLKIDIKKLSLRIVQKTKVYFSEDTNKKLLKIIVLSLMLTISIGEKIQNLLPERVGIVYSFIVLGLFVIVFIYLIKNTMLMSDKWSVVGMIIWLSVIIIMMQMGIVVGILAKAFENPLNFSGVVMTIIILLPIVISILSSLLKLGNQSIFYVVGIIVLFYIFELYIIMLFGIYNLSIERELLMQVDMDSYSSIIKFMEAGYLYVASPPAFGGRAEYMMQYIIGNILHVVLLGFIISFASGFIKKDEDTEKEAT